MRDCLAKSFLLKITPFARDCFSLYCRAASYRVYVMKRVILNSTAAPFGALFLYFFEEKKKVTANPPGNASTFCRRLISWLNIIGEKGGFGSLCLSFSLILIGPSVLLYDPPQLATARSSAAAWCPANDRNPIFHCHRPSTFSRNEISGLARATFSSLKSNFVWILYDIVLTNDIRRISICNEGTIYLSCSSFFSYLSNDLIFLFYLFQIFYIRPIKIELM